ncbi:hypothetical protein GCM10027614_40910 [Micromonospora vulcania]
MGGEPKALIEWLVDELTGNWYGLRRDIAEALIAEDRILPMLDGLDEVVHVHRAACARAIQAFHADHRLLPLVVTSRAADYDVLGFGLELPVTVLVQPLSRAQVEAYLDQFGLPLAGYVKRCASTHHCGNSYRIRLCSA